MNEIKTKIVIVGWGNVGKGVYEAIKRNSDMDLAGIISRTPERVAKELSENICVHDQKLILNYKIGQPIADVAILCGGSKNDLPEQGPEFAARYNTVDSFDTHAKIPEYFAKMNLAASWQSHTSVISAGWDPGTFSLERVLGDAFIPGSVPKGFYGVSEKGGLSMGHSDAIRTIKGVKDARQYTHAMTEAMQISKEKDNPQLTPRDMHWRECFVVLENDIPDERERIKREIIKMPNYFEPYVTIVNFVSQKKLDESFSKMFHDGVVVTTGKTGKENKAVITYSNQWDSNPEATGSILVACARACHRLKREHKTGAYTMLDIPAAYFSRHTRDELLKNFM